MVLHRLRSFLSLVLTFHHLDTLQIDGRDFSESSLVQPDEIRSFFLHDYLDKCWGYHFQAIGSAHLVEIVASQLFIIAVSKSEIVATGSYLELLRVVEIISKEQKELIMKHVNALHLQLLK